MGYPRSPQWRRSRFENPEGWPRRLGLKGFLKWQTSGRPKADPSFRPPVQANDGVQLRTDRQSPSVTWIGHATLMVQAGGFAAITDPVFSKSLGPGVRRWAPPGLPVDRLPAIDCCVVSHNHRDHLDLPSLRALGPAVTYVVPLGLGALLRSEDLHRVIELDWWETATVEGRDGVSSARVSLVPAQHWSQRGPFDANQTLWGGFHLALSGLTAYFAGDTGYPAAFPEIGRRFPGIDLALLPIGAYEPRWFMSAQHMGPDDAVQAFDELGARWLVPMHWGTFRLTDEPMDEPPRRLQQLMAGRLDRVVQLAIGQTHWLAPVLSSSP